MTAAACSPLYCFPNALEDIAVLEWATEANPGDARAPYYLGNLLYDRKRYEEALLLWERSAALDGEFQGRGLAVVADDEARLDRQSPHARRLDDGPHAGAVF